MNAPSITCTPTTVTTRSSAWLDLIKPDPAQIHISDIANHHAMTRRFNTHLDATVAEHVAKGRIVLRDKYPALCACFPYLELAWTLHEGHEPYTGDIVSPMAAAIVHVAGVDAVSIIKSEIQHAVHERFALPWPLPADVRNAIDDVDRIMRATEVRDLRNGEIWADLPAPWPDRLIDPMDEHAAVTAFLDAFIAASSHTPNANDLYGLSKWSPNKSATAKGAA